MDRRVREKLEQRARLAEEARQILNRADAEQRELSGDEQAAFDRLHEQIATLKADADALAAMLTKQAEIEEELGNRARPVHGQAEERGAGRLEAIRKLLVRGAGALSQAEARALSVDNPTAGGFMVAPMELAAEIVKAVDAQTFIRSLATVRQITASETLGIVSLDSDPADADWTTEIGTGSADSSMALGRRELKPRPLAKRILVSRRLLRLSAAAEALVAERFGYVFGTTFEKACLTGAGATGPLGVFTASADGVTTARDVSTGNTATAPTWEGLVNAKFALRPGYWPRASWIFHPDGIKAIAKIRDGEGRPIFEIASAPGMPDRLLGLPVYASEFAPNTFTSAQYVGILGDFSYYWIAESLGLEIQRLEELYAATNQIGFIGRLEADGAPVLAEAFSRVKLG